MTTVNSTTYAAQESAKMALSSGIINTSVKVTSGFSRGNRRTA